MWVGFCRIMQDWCALNFPTVAHKGHAEYLGHRTFLLPVGGRQPARSLS